MLGGCWTSVNEVVKRDFATAVDIIASGTMRLSPAHYRELSKASSPIQKRQERTSLGGVILVL